MRSAAAWAEARDSVRVFLTKAGWSDLGDTRSPVVGGDGNVEFLIAAQKAEADAGRAPA